MSSRRADDLPDARDFDFLIGQWRVHHRKLRRRLVGDTEWQAFEGMSTAFPILGGAGNVDDNVLYGPDEPYRAVTVRRFDRATRCWSIWWLDDRDGRIDVPVVGRFENGLGCFLADDAFDGRPVKVRFVWSDVSADSARWEQAFSVDGGATWEVNWVMDFERLA